MAAKSIGTRVKRKEDQRFITGNGRYTDDFNRPHQCYAVFVRSQWAHARITSLDFDEARAMPGVVSVLTGADYVADGLGSLPCGWMIHSTDGTEMKVPAHPALATDKVNYVGDPYAVVVAETLEQAKAAAEMIYADVEELPAVCDTARAMQSDAIHADIENNRCYHWELGDADAVDAAFEKASHVTSLEFANNRLIPNALEPRAALGDYDKGSGNTTLYTTSQNPHVARLVMSAFIGLAPEHKLKIVSPDVGGGFGSKIFVYSEEVVCAWASKKIGRPVKWTADRSESFMNDAHGRDHVTKASIAMNDDGEFLAMKVNTTANLGAYLSLFASAVPTYLYGTLLAGQYKTPTIHVSVDAVFTNTAPVDAYRGAGRPEATYVVERLVETAARDMNMDPAEIRRRNFIPTTAFPYETPVALTYDIGDYEASLVKALEISNYADFATRRQEAEARGKKRGIGLSCYIEACGLAPSKLAGQLGAGVGLFESAQVRVNPTGNVTVYTGVHSHGQGHETSFAQIVADKLGLEADEVEVVHGDTREVQYGLGTYGSRSLAVGGSALVQATDKVVAKGREIAAYKLESDVDDIDFEDGVYSARGTNKSMTFKEVAFAAYVPHDYPLDKLEPGLEAVAFYDPENFTYPAGTYVCEVEIDPDTGVTKIIQFIAVDDFGRIINPMIVEGQVHGGLAQGIGQALMENGVYDSDSGQLVSGSFMDYTLPRADDLPNFSLDLTETACTHNPLGVKGCGEAGAIGSPPAVINAITDALKVRDIAMPATPLRVWQAIHKEKAA
ncbi:MAG: xanthine dehydrogenase family protein molybdopterin-binding subunit [Sphingomonadales bacterium]|jgi:carbon-monoxide dehydrogenase large subunit